MQDEKNRRPRSRRKKDAPVPPAPYLAHMEADLAGIYTETSGDLDLTEEIRFMRTVHASLGPARTRDACAAMRVLQRLIEAQSRLSGSGAGTGEALHEAAEGIRADLDSKTSDKE